MKHTSVRCRYAVQMSLQRCSTDVLNAQTTGEKDDHNNLDLWLLDLCRARPSSRSLEHPELSIKSIPTSRPECDIKTSSRSNASIHQGKSSWSFSNSYLARYQKVPCSKTTDLKAKAASTYSSQLTSRVEIWTVPGSSLRAHELLSYEQE